MYPSIGYGQYYTPGTNSGATDDRPVVSHLRASRS
jgi:hypothetical protein